MLLGGRKADPKHGVTADPNAYPGIPDFPDGRPVTIGDVYTSDRAVALLHRWHVYTPSDVVADDLAADNLRAAYLHATASPAADWNKPPDQWTDAQEAALIDGIMKRVGEQPDGTLVEAMTEVLDWPPQPQKSWYHFDPTTVGPVGVTRNSFALDTTVTLASGQPSNLPPEPDFSIATRT